jgi:hypothetical protein
MKDFRAAGEAFSPLKRTCISSKHEIYSLFPYFVCQFGQFVADLGWNLI